MVSGHKYKQLKKIMMKKSDLSIEKMSQPSKSERLDFLLRRVKAAGRAKRSNNSNHSTQAEVNQNEKMHLSKAVRDIDIPVMEKEYDLFDAYVSTSTKPNFVEYWVPVRLSEMQTELYCGTLFSNADLLCSYSTRDSMELLNDIFVSILISTKKCCDHPYLVDGSLSTSLIRDIPKPELLNAEIKLSNKLLLLQKILLEIRKRGLRVLILYQSLGGSGSFSVGDILEEIIDQEFGNDLSVRIGGRGRISQSQKRASLNTFNDKDKGRLICLMETRSCVPSIKLTSMDAVIFFNSDWNPMNDLKALQRLDLDSQFKDVKVFRLYSSDTLEEKALILAKQGMALEGHISDIKQSTCHQLLSWGTSYLFNKLDKFHDGNSSIISVENSLEDVFLELSNLLPDNERSSVCEIKNPLIVEVKNVDDVYSSNISLLGEVAEKLLMDSNISLVEKMMLRKPCVFWTKILKGRNPSWKYFSSQPRRLKKSVQRACDLLDEEPASKKSRKEVRRTLYQFPSNIRRKIRSKLRKRDTGRKLTGGEKCNLMSNIVQHGCLPSSRTTQNDHSHGTHPPEVHHTAHKALPRRERRREQSNVIEARDSLTSRNPEPPEAFQVALKPVCNALQIELEGLQKQKSELLKIHEEKKSQTIMECKKEIDQIRKKYDMLLQNAETTLLEERKVIDAKYSKVLINKTLAEAVVHKYSAEDSTLSQVTSKCSSEEMYQLYLRWSRSNTIKTPNQFAEIQPGCSVPEEPPTHESLPESLASRTSQYVPESQVRRAAPHFWHMRSPQPVAAPKSSPAGADLFLPVVSRPVTSSARSLQGSHLWALSSLTGLPL